MGKTSSILLKGLIAFGNASAPHYCDPVEFTPPKKLSFCVGCDQTFGSLTQTGTRVARHVTPYEVEVSLSEDNSRCSDTSVVRHSISCMCERCFVIQPNRSFLYVCAMQFLGIKEESAEWPAIIEAVDAGK